METGLALRGKQVGGLEPAKCQGAGQDRADTALAFSLLPDHVQRHARQAMEGAQERLAKLAGECFLTFVQRQGLRWKLRLCLVV